MAQFFNEESVGIFKKIIKENVKPIPNGGFEFSDFTTYINVSQTTNYWIVGTNSKYSGNYAAYITNNNSSSVYDNTQSQFSHFYRDIKVDRDFPKIRFKAKVGGEANNDYLSVYVSEAIYNPIPGRNFEPLTSYAYSGKINLNSNFLTYEINLSNAIDKVVRVTFSWVNNSSGGIQPSAIIDDIEFFSDPDQIISLDPSVLKIKGQIREFLEPIYLNTSIVGLGGLDVGFLEPSTFYNIFAVYEFKNIYLVASKNSEPLGFNSFKLVGRFRTNIDSQIEEIKYSYILDNYLENFEFFQLKNDLFIDKINNLCVSNWESYTATTTSFYWSSVCFGDNKYVAVSSDTSKNTNKIIYSENGLDWSAVTNYTNISSFNSVIYANKIFVAIANSSDTSLNIATSTNGSSWFSQTSPSGRNWSSLTYGDGLFVAVAKSGSGNRVMTSTNGSSWTLRTTPADNNWESVTYGKGYFVAVASSGSENRVMISSNGFDWQIINEIQNNTWNSVCYGKGIFVAVSSDGSSRIMVSQDAINWQLVDYPILNSWKSVSYDYILEHFIIVSEDGTQDRVIVSRDGFLWNPKVNPNLSYTFVTGVGGEFFALTNKTTNFSYAKSLKIYS